jgi:hypothetical protein
MDIGESSLGLLHYSFDRREMTRVLDPDLRINGRLPRMPCPCLACHGYLSVVVDSISITGYGQDGALLDVCFLRHLTYLPIALRLISKSIKPQISSTVLDGRNHHSPSFPRFHIHHHLHTNSSTLPSHHPTTSGRHFVRSHSKPFNSTRLNQYACA